MKRITLTPAFILWLSQRQPGGGKLACKMVEGAALNLEDTLHKIHKLRAMYRNQIRNPKDHSLPHRLHNQLIGLGLEMIREQHGTLSLQAPAPGIQAVQVAEPGEYYWIIEYIPGEAPQIQKRLFMPCSVRDTDEYCCESTASAALRSLYACM